MFRRLLKEEVISDFQSLLYLLSSKRVTEMDDSEYWSIDPSGRFSVKSQSVHLSPSFPLDKGLLKHSGNLAAQGELTF